MPENKTEWLPLAGIAAFVLWVWPRPKKGAAPAPIPSVIPTVPVAADKPAVLVALYQAGKIPNYQVYLNFYYYFLGQTGWSQADARAALEDARKRGWVTYNGYSGIYAILYA